MTELKNKVLILYPHRGDTQSLMLYEELLKLGMEVLYLPFRCDDEETCSRGFCFDNGEIRYLGHDLRDLKAVFIRALAFSVPANLPAYLSRSEQAIWRAKYIQENIRFSSLFSMLNILKHRGVLIINHPRAYFQHNSKAQFFSLLRNKGFSVPELISTNDHQSARSFCKETTCVSKSAYGVGATRAVNEESLFPGCGLNKTPALFQKKVNGDTIRIHTVGSRAVLSLKIHSEGVDSRSDTAGFSVIELPAEIEHEIGTVNNMYESYYSAWDVMMDEKGRFHLLDFNPGPYIGWTGVYFTRFVMSALARFIRIYNDGKSIQQNSASMKIPDPEFTNVWVNCQSLVHDYTPEYRKGLRIRI